MAWNVHCCRLDSHCRKYGGPWRIGVTTPWWHLDVALSPGSRFVQLGGRTNWFLFRRYER